MFVERCVIVETTFVHGFQSLWHLFRLRLVRTKPSRILDFAIPMWRPNAVALTKTGRPGKHRLAEFDFQRLAQPPQQSTRAAQNVLRIEHWRRLPGAASHPIENL